MGWKASCILINERSAGYLGTKPPHDSQRAHDLVQLLDLGRFKSRGPTTFEQGVFPNRLTIGAYDGAAIIGDPGLAGAEFSMDRYPPLIRLLTAFPRAKILGIALHSVINLFGYYYFEQGRLLRAYAGCADDGVVVDQGELQPEERPFFERSTMRDGERFFVTEIDGVERESGAASFGETLVFEMSKPFLGCSLDWFDGWDLGMEEFERQRSGWRRLFRR